VPFGPRRDGETYFPAVSCAYPVPGELILWQVLNAMQQCYIGEKRYFNCSTVATFGATHTSSPFSS
jgi:hypothetical protein